MTISLRVTISTMIDASCTEGEMVAVFDLLEYLIRNRSGGTAAGMGQGLPINSSQVFVRCTLG
jgi:hypothetical protein